MPHQFTVRLAAAAVMAVINVALGGVAASALPPELRSTAADQEAVAVTIYNQDLAL